ncbi:RNA polymerase Rpb1, domain 7, partial [Teladorsagia circumcincta]
VTWYVAIDEYSMLVDFLVVSNTAIHYDSHPERTSSEEDEEWVSIFYETAHLIRAVPLLGMTDKKLSMEHIADKIQQGFRGDVNVICTDDNADELVLRLRITNQLSDQSAEVEQVDEMGMTSSRVALSLCDLTLQCIGAVSNVYMHKPTTDD